LPTKGAGIMGAIAVSELLWKRHLQRTLERHEVTLKQYYVLRQLSRRPHLHPAEIATGLFCDRPTASVVIANLEKRGWLVRARDEANHKRALVRLTEAGRAKLAAVDANPPNPQRPGLDPLACFDESELAQLAALLPRLRAHLEQTRAPQQPVAVFDEGE
jgi:DNA-binding MarR family transcriptional regulator